MTSSSLYDNFLVCNASTPFIIGTNLAEEALIYNLSSIDINQIIQDFSQYCGKVINKHDKIAYLSGGQKVMLMILIALQSQAEDIMFIGIDTALDSERRKVVNNLLSLCSKKIVIRSHLCDG